MREGSNEKISRKGWSFCKRCSPLIKVQKVSEAQSNFKGANQVAQAQVLAALGRVRVSLDLQLRRTRHQQRRCKRSKEWSSTQTNQVSPIFLKSSPPGRSWLSTSTLPCTRSQFWVPSSASASRPESTSLASLRTSARTQARNPM